ncbi:MAG: hypothetical protein NT141_02960 [candidate division WWE3 bacterium]|nr:hypothetical protein [candidate division WWE3 bacterium]
MILFKIKKFEITLFEAVIYFLIFWIFFINPLVWVYKSNPMLWSRGINSIFKVTFFPLLSTDKNFNINLLLNYKNLSSDLLLTNINLAIGFLAAIFTRFVTKRGKN